MPDGAGSDVHGAAQRSDARVNGTSPQQEGPGGLLARLGLWQCRLVASPGFQAWAARFPLTRGLVRRETVGLHDLVSGFVYSQVLLAAVELELFERLADGPADVAALSAGSGIAPDRMETLCQAASALGLMARMRDGRYRLARRGAAVLGAPGLRDMIRHHRVFYRDLADPVAVLRGEAETELARFWPYVLGVQDGTGAGIDPAQAAEYSRLMETSQRMVAAETLAAVSFARVRHLADIGGGTGAFLEAVASAHPGPKLTLMDLPEVAAQAEARLGRKGLAGRLAVVPGSFLDDPLPRDADAITLVRVLYDHEDATVRRLLARVHAALPPGGQLIVSEPMSGGERPARAADAYFGFYTMAMGTGRTRSPDRHAALLAEAGFTEIRRHSGASEVITSVLSARRPA